VHKTAAVTAAAIKMSVALLNSGTFGVDVEPGEVEVSVIDVGVDVGLEVPLDGSDITARLPMKPSVEPWSLTAYNVFVPES
jgi:hypothetical protein